MKKLITWILILFFVPTFIFILVGGTIGGVFLWILDNAILVSVVTIAIFAIWLFAFIKKGAKEQKEINRVNDSVNQLIETKWLSIFNDKFEQRKTEILSKMPKNHCKTMLDDTCTCIAFQGGYLYRGVFIPKERLKNVIHKLIVNDNLMEHEITQKLNSLLSGNTLQKIPVSKIKECSINRTGHAGVDKYIEISADDCSFVCPSTPEIIDCFVKNIPEKTKSRR